MLSTNPRAGEEGKVRFVRYTGHKDRGLHLQMLHTGLPFDTVQMPLNCFDASFRSLAERVLPQSNRRGIVALGMKSVGGSGEMIASGQLR